MSGQPVSWPSTTADLINTVEVQQDGHPVLVAATAIDFVGAAVDASGAGVEVTIQGGSTVATAAGTFPVGTPTYASSADHVDHAFAGGSGSVARVEGLTANAVVAGAAVTIVTDGPLTLATAAWDVLTGDVGGLRIGSTYYLSATSAGKLVTERPSSGGTWVTAVGYAISPTILIVRILAPIATDGAVELSLMSNPVSNSRMWATALVPDGSGGWNFITQCYNYPNDEPTQWVVDHLEADTYTFDVGPNEIFSNTNFQYNNALQANGPLIAANGRVFFPCASTPDPSKLNIAYYAPSDQHVHFLSFTNPDPASHTAEIFSGMFNHSGDTIYFGTGSSIGSSPSVFRLDPATLEYTAIATVGPGFSDNPSYCYYVAADEGPTKYLYVAYGQETWELISVNLSTNTPTTLYTTSGPGQQFIQFDAFVQGWRTTIIDNGVSTQHWLADGVLSAYPGSGAPPQGARNVIPYANIPANQPDINPNLVAGAIAWRPNGSSGDYTVNTYPITIVDPIPIESLIALPAVRMLFGNTVQYNGFWRLTLGSDVTWYGPGAPALLSEPALAYVDDTHLYMCGYPNGTLYVYDTTLPWNPLDVGGNPAFLGVFHDTGSFMKYCYFIQRSSVNGKLYAVGRRERDGTGSGVGTYDPETTTFTGNVNAPLPTYTAPRGWAVLDDIEAVAFSGETQDGSDAAIVLFDLDLNVIDQHVVHVGTSDSGLIFKTATPGVVIGVAPAGGAVYRFNVQTGALLDWAPQVGAIGSSSPSQNPRDLSVWFTLGSKLVRIDAVTFAITVIGTFQGVVIDSSSSFTTWLDDELYLANDAAFYSVRL